MEQQSCPNSATDPRNLPPPDAKPRMRATVHMAIGTVMLLTPAVLREVGLGRPETLDAMALAIGSLFWFAIAYILASVVFLVARRSQTWANAVFLFMATLV